MRRVLISLLVLLAGCSQVRNTVTASRGAADLRRFPFDGHLLSLDGNWEFCPGQLLKPSTFDSCEKQSFFLRVPGAWNQAPSSILPGEGNGTYRLRIFLPDESRRKIFLPNIHSSYRLYLNGKQTLQIGNPGVSAEQSSAQFRPARVDLPQTTEIELVIAVSNFQHRNGGLWKSILIGSEDEIDRNWTFSEIWEALQFGFFISVSVLFLFLFAGTPRHRELLFFAILSFLAAFRSVLTQQRTLIQIWPDFPFEVNYALEYITFYASPPIALLMVHGLFASVRSRKLDRVLMAVLVFAGVLLAMVIITPSRIYTQTFEAGLVMISLVWVFIVFLTAKAVAGRLPAARWFAFALFFPFLGSVNDYLHNSNLIQTFYMSSVTNVAFFLSLAMILSRRASLAEIEIKSLSADNTARREMLSMMSHELRNPLNGIVGMIQLMQETGLDETQKEYMKSMERGADALMLMINDVLEFGRIEAGQAQPYYEFIKIREFVSGIVGVFQGQALIKGLLLTSSVDSRIPEAVYAAPRELGHILTNLVANALKFTEKGFVSLNCEAVMDGSKIAALSYTVADSGIGVPADSLDLIFKPFVQARPGSVSTGSGLGLAICRRLSDILQGRLSVESNPEKGSAFRLMLPFSCEQPPVQEIEIAPVGPPRKRILIADDDDISADLVARFLGNVDAKLERVANGKDALSRILENEYDLVIMDLKLPDIDGSSIIRELRRTQTDGVRTPVIVVSADIENLDTRRWTDLGFDAALPKPLRKNQLMDLLHSVTGLK